ncbi:MAG: hypothetical protein HY820_18430 [Acidobacteria bacterium]|nr:hypothetical protein [Acidobacteriota bacterium]
MAIQVFGPGVTAFGNGRDGGREATFAGRVPHPYPPTECWDGYGVIQAKCKEKPETTEKDQAWALEQLEKELKRFVADSARSPKPEYYVFVVNVELSSVPRGGKDQAKTLVERYYGELGMKDHTIWDGNQLRAFVDRYGELRTRFRAHLTTGDLIAALIPQKPDAVRILRGFLDRELRGDAAARLDQAGKRTDEQLQLARLFVDLPASAKPSLMPPEEKDDESTLLPGVLDEMLRCGSCRLDAQALYDQEERAAKGECEFNSRFVLIGGPGSGKSTLGQFLCQIHRAALLRRAPPHLLEQAARTIMDETERACATLGLSWPATPRYPFRVELNRFASWIRDGEQNGQKTLAEYLLVQLKGAYQLAYEDLLEWLATYPWLLVLDGLDEVPASSNRHEMMTAIERFLSEARAAVADLFVVATSRAEGYGREFLNALTASRFVLPLARRRALQYVEKYALTRFGKDDRRSTEIVEKVRGLAGAEITAALMTSPLQVTFMVTVVAAQGDPGENRWQLMDSYYRTIYERECQKAVAPYNSVLNSQRLLINRLHHDVGFWLQWRGESTRGSGVSLSLDVFAQLVDRYLMDAGHEGSRKEELKRDILHVASQRLIFLTSRIAGELSFEVRSLQEYAAAECLMSRSGSVKLRLDAIAASPYWRNVFLFAASKCFVDSSASAHQDTIRLVCHDLNISKDELLQVTKAGSDLALDILRSRATAQNPKQERLLAEIALHLIEEPDRERQAVATDVRLAAVCSPSVEAIFQNRLRSSLGRNEVARTLGAWQLLARLVDSGEDWAEVLRQRYWPASVDQQLEIANVVDNWMTWIVGDLRRNVWRLPPEKAIGVVWWKTGLVHETGDDQLHIRVTVRTSVEGFTVGFRPAFAPKREPVYAVSALASVADYHPGWQVLRRVNDFLADPCARVLAEIFEECLGHPFPDTKLLEWLPWPMANCIERARSISGLRGVVDELRSGQLGDAADWKAAEERLSIGEIPVESLADLMGTIESDGAHSIGFPYVSSSGVHMREYLPFELTEFANAIRCIKSTQARRRLLWILSQASSRTGGVCAVLGAKEIGEIWTSGDQWDPLGCGFPKEESDNEVWIDLFDRIGRESTRDSYHESSGTGGKWCSVFERAFRNDLRRVGLLRLMGWYASSGVPVDVIPSDLLAPIRFAKPAFRLAAILVRLSQGTLGEVEAVQLADACIELLNPEAEEDAFDQVIRTSMAHIVRVPAIAAFVLRIRNAPLGISLQAAQCDRVLRRLAKERSSEIYPEDLTPLGLPIVEDPVTG